MPVMIQANDTNRFLAVILAKLNPNDRLVQLNLLIRDCIIDQKYEESLQALYLLWPVILEASDGATTQDSTERDSTYSVFLEMKGNPALVEYALQAYASSLSTLFTYLSSNYHGFVPTAMGHLLTSIVGELFDALSLMHSDDAGKRFGDFLCLFVGTVGEGHFMTSFPVNELLRASLRAIPKRLGHVPTDNVLAFMKATYEHSRKIELRSQDEPLAKISRVLAIELAHRLPPIQLIQIFLSDKKL